MSRIAPKYSTPTGLNVGFRNVATLHVSMTEKAPAASTTATSDSTSVQIGFILISRRNSDAISKRERIAGGGQQQRVDQAHPAHRIGEARQRAKEEVTAPADRLENPEGAVLVVEERPVEAHAAGDRLRRRLDLGCVGLAAGRGRPPVEGRAVGRHGAGYRGAARHCERRLHDASSSNLDWR